MTDTEANNVLKANHGNKNKYIHRSKIFEAKFRQFVRLFFVDLNATQITWVVGLNRDAADRLLQGTRTNSLCL